MTVKVTFLSTRSLGSINAPAIGPIRSTETVALAAVSTASGLADEVAMVFNGETTAILVAHGSTPDAAATVATALTSAGLPVAAGQLSSALKVDVGSKISVKTLT